MEQGLGGHWNARMRMQHVVTKVLDGRKAQSCSPGNSKLASHYPATPPTVRYELIFSINPVIIL